VGGQGRLGRERGVLVEGERLILPDDLDLIAVDLLDAVEGRTDPRAEGSLEI
jgi:hypothetical protein